MASLVQEDPDHRQLHRSRVARPFWRPPASASRCRQSSEPSASPRAHGCISSTAPRRQPTYSRRLRPASPSRRRSRTPSAVMTPRFAFVLAMLLGIGAIVVFDMCVGERSSLEATGRVALSQVGVRETSRNSGPEVDAVPFLGKGLWAPVTRVVLCFRPLVLRGTERIGEPGEPVPVARTARCRCRPVGHDACRCASG